MNKMNLDYEELIWFTDSMGNLFESASKKVPLSILNWYESVRKYAEREISSDIYLVYSITNGYGLLLVNGYGHPVDAENGESYREFVRGTYLEFAETPEPMYNRLLEFSDSIGHLASFVGHSTGFGDSHELGVFLPYDYSLPEIAEAVGKIKYEKVLPSEKKGLDANFKVRVFMKHYLRAETLLNEGWQQAAIESLRMKKYVPIGLSIQEEENRTYNYYEVFMEDDGLLERFDITLPKLGEKVMAYDAKELNEKGYVSHYLESLFDLTVDNSLYSKLEVGDFIVPALSSEQTRILGIENKFNFLSPEGSNDASEVIINNNDDKLILEEKEQIVGPLVVEQMVVL